METNKEVKEVKEKDKHLKVIVPGTAPAQPPHVAFVEQFAKYYALKTGHKYKADRKHYAIAARLMRDFGPDAMAHKARVLASRCEARTEFYARRGWEDFTIESLSTHWNRLIGEQSQDESISKMFERMEAEREQLDSIVKQSRAAAGL